MPAFKAQLTNKHACQKLGRWYWMAERKDNEIQKTEKPNGNDNIYLR